MAALNSRIQVKSHCHTEKQGFDYQWLPKKFHQTHPQKRVEAEPYFRKVNILPAKLGLLFGSLLVLAGNLLPLTAPGLRPTIQNS